MTHPIYGSKTKFSSWIELCEITLDLAKDHLEQELKARIIQLADEMIETAKAENP